ADPRGRSGRRLRPHGRGSGPDRLRARAGVAAARRPRRAAANAAGALRRAGDGFRSGLLVGAALGFVYAPCAGPILAAVVSVAATMGASFKLVVIALAYGAGSAAVLFVYAYGGRRLLEPLRRAGRGPILQRVLGVVMVLTAIAIATDLDLRFQTALANGLPDFLTNPTHGLERSHAVENRLAKLRGRPRFHEARASASGYPVLG